MSQRLKWGIISTGAIAKTFAKGVAHSMTGEVVAVASRTQATADAFGGQFNIPRRYATYEALLEDKSVDAVYIATPHPFHAEWAIKSAEAGKHILVEKPIGLNHAEAMACIEAAREHDVFLMEAYMYRCHPQIAELIKLIREKAIGEVRVIHAAFSFHWPIPYDPESRLIANDMAGGGILDVGGYCTSMSRLIAGVANGLDGPAEPTEVRGVGHLGQTGTDDYALAVAKFPGGIVAELSSGVQVNREAIVRIDGSEGHLIIPQPWVPTREGGQSQIIVHRKDEPQPRTISIESNWLYAIEADTVATHLANRQAKFPAMSWDDTLGNMKMLDAWRTSIGLTYDAEKIDADVPTITRRPLRRRQHHNMTYARIVGLDKDVSRLIFGCDNQTTLPHMSIMLDDFFERGGNAFDTAHIYGGGLQEKLLGRWIRNRGVRNDVVVIAKGAHTPFCNPRDLSQQLLISLDRLGLDGADLYMMHRDNPDVPVGEFVDVLNEHARAARFKVFGGSNWTIDRLEAANTYAASKGLQGFGVVSNNFSLARMVEPPWAGCVSASDKAWRSWLKKMKIPLLAWSSQARGFFIPGRAALDRRDDSELVRCWYADDNFQRLERVNEMARSRNVLPINIALAYVLNQPFATFPLIGPRTLRETHTSLPALNVQLSPGELRWLNLEDEAS